MTTNFYTSKVVEWCLPYDCMELSIVSVCYLCVESDSDGVCCCDFTDTFTIRVGFRFGESDFYEILLPLTF